MAAMIRMKNAKVNASFRLEASTSDGKNSRPFLRLFSLLRQIEEKRKKINCKFINRRVIFFTLDTNRVRGHNYTRRCLDLGGRRGKRQQHMLKVSFDPF